MNLKKAVKPPNKQLMIVFNDMSLGGIQRKIVDIISFIQKKYPRFKIILCLQSSKGIFLHQVSPNIKVISPPIHTRRLNNLWFTFWLSYIFNKYRPGYILSFMDLCSISTLIAIKPFSAIYKPKIIIGEDILTSKHVYTETFPKIRLKLIKVFYPQADKILVQTPIQKKDLHQIIGKSDNVIVSPNWLPLVFPPKTKSKNPKNIDILFIGRIDPQKNLTMFVNIIQKVSLSNPNIKAVIVGDGTETTTIKQLIKKLHLQKNIRIFPATKNPQKFYLQAKIFLLTSDYEGFPLTLLEAISCGCFPLSRNIPEVVKFFNHQASKTIFKYPHQAAKLITQQISQPNINLIHYYQKKIISLQKKHISLFINYCLSKNFSG